MVAGLFRVSKEKYLKGRIGPKRQNLLDYVRNTVRSEGE